jgi:hypothetical protein
VRYQATKTAYWKGQEERRAVFGRVIGRAALKGMKIVARGAGVWITGEVARYYSISLGRFLLVAGKTMTLNS